MHIISTIIPIFAIIILGWFARRKGFIQPEFLGPANRLVYHLAIPAMVFRSIVGASLKAHVNAAVLSITLICILIIFASAWVVGKIVGARQGQLGSFIHSTFHGNLGYIGLAVSYYALGNQGLIWAGIIAGFMMIMQNLLGVIAFQLYSDNSFVNQKKLTVILKILGNPVIVSAMAGILFSFIEDPDVIRKILKHLDLWEIKSRPPPKANAPPAETFIISDDQQMPSADDYLIDPAFPVEAYL